MMRRPYLFVSMAALACALSASSSAQVSGKRGGVSATAALERATSLAESGHCTEALPELSKATPHISDRALQKRAALDGVRCATLSQQRDQLLTFLRILNLQFPHDPEVLYVSAHAFSDLATQATQELAAKASDSIPALEMDAEVNEMQGKWDQAEKDYRTISGKNPRYPGIHFRLARLLLSKPNPLPGFQEEAKTELNKELEIDPSNAGAEYVLGELTRQAGDLPEAVRHFARATKLEPNFADAYLGLGVSLLAQQSYADAVSPLETAVKLRPENPAGHYNLATAYARTGRRDEAQRELALQRQAAERGAGDGPQKPQ